MSAATIHVIGISGEWPPSREAERVLAQARRVIGAPRHLEMLGAVKAEKIVFPQPFDNLSAVLAGREEEETVILASGDPLFYGLGNWLLRHLDASRLRFLPAVSSVQQAFARIGKPWQRARIVSVHGRPLSCLRAALKPGELYALLTDKESQPQAVARELAAANLLDSTIWVAESLGWPEERVRRFNVGELLAQQPQVQPLHVTIIETAGEGGVLPVFPGIDDALFETGDEPRHMISKREVRLAILSHLQPRAHDIGWDIGAGCGGLAVEWARWNPLGEVHAVEEKENRFTALQANREKFGVVLNLHPVLGRAPQALAALPDPDVVFIGGSGGELESILAQCWQRLKKGGRLVATSVTEESRGRLMNFIADKQAKWLEISVARGESLGGQRMLRPQRPVLLIAAQKAAK